MTQKITTAMLILLLAGIQLFAAEKDTTFWKSKYESSITFSQTTFTKWVAGGENNVSANAFLNIFKDYKKDKLSWNNYLGVAYGLSNQKTIGLRKIEDKINFFTKGGLYAWKNWDYTGLFEFKSQFDKGYAYPNKTDYISKFLAPAYFQMSLGLNYKPVEYFSVFISPIGTRLTVVNDTSLTNRPEGAYGIYGDNSTLWQVGWSVNALFKKEVVKNISLLSKLDLFADYKKDPVSPFMSWENNILMKVNRFISLSIATSLISDPLSTFIEKNENNEVTSKISGPLQFRETIGVGFAYSFSSLKPQKTKK